jgi:dolichol-phosphate mannosyltransferase
MERGSEERGSGRRAGADDADPDMKKKMISIVAPVFEEGKALPIFIEQLRKELGRLDHYDWEIILVDDGSRDESLKVIKRHRENDPRIKWVSFTRNFGQQAALAAGVERASGDAIITMDSDLQHPTSMIPELISKWESGFALVLTIRRESPNVNAFKRLASRGFYRLINFMSPVRIPEAAADYRLMSREVARQFIKFSEVHRFIRGLVAWMGIDAAEIRYFPGERVCGEPKYTWGRMLRFGVDGITSFSIMPLRMIAGVGFAIFALTLLYMIYAVIIWWIHPQSLQIGWTSLLISVNLLGGVILLALGIIGEYVGRIYEQVKNRPIYIIKGEDGFR